MISTLIVGAIGTAIAVSLVLLGLDSSRNSLVLLQSDQAKALANACAEDAMEKLRELPSFSGNGSVIVGSDTCSYNVVNSGANATVTASATIGTIVRKVNVTSNAIGASWQEVP